jgi:mannose-P-dolichol utilization defect protein 1
MISTLFLTLTIVLACASLGQAFVTPASLSARHHNDFAFAFASKTRASTVNYLSPLPLIDSSLLLCGDGSEVVNPIAQTVGYLVGVGSFLLYTPIAVRLLRTKSAEGLTISTWWMKVTAFTCLDTYNIKNGFPLAAWSESLVNTVESGFVLCLVAFYQRRLDVQTFLLATTYITASLWALLAPASFGPSGEVIQLAQMFSIVLNTSALLPQLRQNFERQSSGDYSTITALVALLICGTRIYTTIELANGDPLLLLNYGVLFLLNVGLLAQVLYYGTQVEGRELASLFLDDIKSDDSSIEILAKDASIIEDADKLGSVTSNPIVTFFNKPIIKVENVDERVSIVSRK